MAAAAAAGNGLNANVDGDEFDVVYEQNSDDDDDDNDIEVEEFKTVKYYRTALSEKVLIFEIPQFEELYRPSQPDHPFYTYHDKPFSKERYLYSTLPVHVGPFKIKYPKGGIINVLHCPIKNSGSKKFILPNELLFLKEFITFCALYETSFNQKRFRDLFVHVTVDFKNLQHFPGFRVDGFQGHKFPVKHEIEHSYLWSNGGAGKQFCPQPFFISHIDDSKYGIFNEFDKQARTDNLISCMPENIYIYDPYMVYRSPPPILPNPKASTTDSGELFIKITFEYHKLLDPNDTINPNLKFPIPYKYDIRNRLGEYPVPLQPEMYGFSKVDDSLSVSSASASASASKTRR